MTESKQQPKSRETELTSFGNVEAKVKPASTEVADLIAAGDRLAAQAVYDFSRGRLRAKNSCKEAKEKYKKALAQTKNSVTASQIHEKIGDFYILRANSKSKSNEDKSFAELIDKAKEKYGAALKLNDNNYSAKIKRSEARVNHSELTKGRLEEAIRDLKDVLSLKPQPPNKDKEKALIVLGNAIIALQKLLDNEKSFFSSKDAQLKLSKELADVGAQLIALKQNFFGYYFAARSNQGNLKEAIDAYTQALEATAPDNNYKCLCLQHRAAAYELLYDRESKDRNGNTPQNNALSDYTSVIKDPDASLSAKELHFYLRGKLKEKLGQNPFWDFLRSWRLEGYKYQFSKIDPDMKRKKFLEQTLYPTGTPASGFDDQRTEVWERQFDRFNQEQAKQAESEKKIKAEVKNRLNKSALGTYGCFFNPQTLETETALEALTQMQQALEVDTDIISGYLIPDVS